jgi:succinate dehydrogenase / fumarate reductase membrane anchor subunit
MNAQTESAAREWTLQHHLSVANLLLGSWLAVSFALMPDFGMRTVADWLSGTLPMLALVLFVITAFWHARLGLQVLIDDYVHDAGYNFAAMVVVNFATVTGAVAGLYFIVRIVAYVAATEMAAVSMMAQQGMMGGR